MAASDSVHGLGPLTETGEELDLDRVYREHGAAVSRWVQRLDGHRDASDAVQEVFMVAQRRLPTFRGDAKLATWLYGITVRVVSARRRKARLRALLFLQARAELELEASASEAPDAELQRRQATRIVYSVLDGLSERDRTLLILFELERFPVAEIGAILEISQNSVSVGLHRARARFRKLLERRFPESKESVGP